MIAPDCTGRPNQAPAKIKFDHIYAPEDLGLESCANGEIQVIEMLVNIM